MDVPLQFFWPPLKPVSASSKLCEFILNVLHSFPDEVELLQTWKWPEKTPLTNLCGYGASSNTVTCYPLLALFLPGGE